ncbi:glycoside hydrolase family 25 protein [Streptomyces qinglanensis]|uniref:Glycosyl hydrolases family 25 n=1 Tax=Streptomyces qinglanensis TaxID=943816 RepID=A0A1H9U2A1_9ACTN|nr:GH25 family lysozyme [Streptomyces qinglanensis]SES03213.1 Glycosyl hydrolases family 25 [Streptomyces qinglanensis]
MIKGIDVSSYQPERYGTRGLDFAIIKITEGTSYTNPKWVAQRQTGRDAGLVTGFYHFVRPGSMKAQADYFLSKINLRAGDILVLDWEDPGVSSADKDAWIKYVQGKAPGHRVLLYCNVDYWKNRDKSSFAGDGLWIAQYNGHAGSPSIQAPWLIHQYTSTPIDTNLARFADRAAMKAWATSGSGSTPEDDMPTQKELYEGAWELDGEMTVPWGSETNPTWKPKSVLIHVGEVARETRGRVKGLESAVAELAAKGAARDAVLAKLAEGGGLTAAEVQAAADAGAQAALDRLADALAKGQP